MLFVPYRKALLPYADVFLVAYQPFSIHFPEAATNVDLLKESIFQIKEAGKRAFLLINKFIFEPEIVKLENFITIIGPLVDGFIVNDLGLFLLLKKFGLQKEVYLHTNTTITNHWEVEVLLKQGFYGSVLARELTLQELKTIAEKFPQQVIIPVFGHQLIATSRRPLLQSYAKYVNRTFPPNEIFLMQEEKRNDYFLIYEDSGGFHIFDEKILNGLPFLQEFLEVECRNFWFDFFAISDEMAIKVLKQVNAIINNQLSSAEKNSSYLHSKESGSDELASCSFSSKVDNFSYGLWFTNTSEAKDYEKNQVQEESKKRLLEFFATKNIAPPRLNLDKSAKVSSADLSMELLAPAGDLSRLKTAVKYGADAVFVGGKTFSLRSRASNFDYATLQEGVNFAHKHGARVHVTVNMIPHEYDLAGLKRYLLALSEIGVDAIIVASLAILDLARQLIPEVEIHISTQYSITHHYAIDFYKEMGAKRVVIAREHSLSELEELSKKASLPLEVFIHGGMCVHYSGRCTLSNYMTARDANRGGCAQSCRWRYSIFSYQKDEQGNLKFRNSPQKMDLLSDPDLLFTMSSKDLNAMEVLPELHRLKVASLKIEGRMKTDYYIATVVSSYRTAIDALNQNLLIEDKKQDTKVDTEVATEQDTIQTVESKRDKQAEIIKQGLENLLPSANRKTFTGFYLNMPMENDHLYETATIQSNQTFVAQAIFYNAKEHRLFLQVRNPFCEGDILEILEPDKEIREFIARDLVDSNGEKTGRFYKAMEEVSLYCDFPVAKEAYIRLKSKL